MTLTQCDEREGHRRVRTERDKWRVPEEDPAGKPPQRSPKLERLQGSTGTSGKEDSLEEASSRPPLIYCGQCGALNPATNHFCAACGATLVDAFHASEGLRVYERPDPASRIIEIVPAGSELDIVEDPDAPLDFVRVKLATGRLGYIRLHDVELLAGQESSPSPPIGAPDVNTRALGCVSSTAALAALVLLIVVATLSFYLMNREDIADTGFLALVTCLVTLPLLLLTVVLYVIARSREERLAAEAAQSAYGADQGDN